MNHKITLIKPLWDHMQSLPYKYRFRYLELFCNSKYGIADIPTIQDTDEARKAWEKFRTKAKINYVHGSKIYFPQYLEWVYGKTMPVNKTIQKLYKRHDIEIPVRMVNKRKVEYKKYGEYFENQRAVTKEHAFLKNIYRKWYKEVVDIEAVFIQIQEWLDAPDNEKKKYRNYTTFYNNWLRKEAKKTNRL